MVRKRSGWPLTIVIAARRLDGALDRLGAGIGEEHLVGEGRGDQPLGEAALAGNLVEVGDVPELAGLLGQRGDEMRVAVAERVDGDAAAEIEVALAVVGDQPAALAPLEGQGRPRKGIEKRRTAHYMRLRNRHPGIAAKAECLPAVRPKIKKPPKRRPTAIILWVSAMKSTKTSRN